MEEVDALLLSLYAPLDPPTMSYTDSLNGIDDVQSGKLTRGIQIVGSPAIALATI